METQFSTSAYFLCFSDSSRSHPSDVQHWLWNLSGFAGTGRAYHAVSQVRPSLGLLSCRVTVKD